MKPGDLIPLLLAAGSVMTCSSCGSRKVAAAVGASEAPLTVSQGRGAIIQSERRFDRDIVRSGGGAFTPVQAVAKAVVYRMSGDYASNVAIALTPDGKGVLSYPAPTDFTAASTPVEIGGGWWLSRCGITPASVFTRYTYDEYRALAAAPAPAQLLEAVIPGARVTECRILDMTPQEALDNLPALKEQLTFTYQPQQ